VYGDKLVVVTQTTAACFFPSYSTMGGFGFRYCFWYTKCMVLYTFYDVVWMRGNLLWCYKLKKNNKECVFSFCVLQFIPQYFSSTTFFSMFFKKLYVQNNNRMVKFFLLFQNHFKLLSLFYFPVDSDG